MKNINKIDVAEQLKEFEEIESKFIKEAKSEEVHTDESYEVYRDAFRFMTKVFIICIALSLMINLACALILSMKEPGKAYVTSRDGFVEQIHSVARR